MDASAGCHDYDLHAAWPRVCAGAAADSGRPKLQAVLVLPLSVVCQRRYYEGSAELPSCIYVDTTSIDGARYVRVDLAELNYREGFFVLTEAETDSLISALREATEAIRQA